MEELHENEQYFFSKRTLKLLSTSIASSGFNDVCCLCSPMLGLELYKKINYVSILDKDNRFVSVVKSTRRKANDSDKNNDLSHLWFVNYDLNRPRYIGWNFDLIVCDPPFFSVPLHNLLRSIYTISKYNYRIKLLISYVKRREEQLLQTFEKYNLKPTGFHPEYDTVQNSGRNEIEFYSNIENIKDLGWFNLLLLK